MTYPSDERLAEYGELIDDCLDLVELRLGGNQPEEILSRNQLLRLKEVLESYRKDARKGFVVSHEGGLGMSKALIDWGEPPGELRDSVNKIERFYREHFSQL